MKKCFLVLAYLCITQGYNLIPKFKRVSGNYVLFLEFTIYCFCLLFILWNPNLLKRIIKNLQIFSLKRLGGGFMVPPWQISVCHFHWCLE